MNIEELLKFKKLPEKDQLTDEVLSKLFIKYKGLLKERERDKAFWESTHENIEHAYAKIDKLVEERTAELQKEVTERKKQENALRESEYNLIIAQEIALLGNWKLNIVTMEVEGSKELIKLFGLESYKLNLDDFVKVVHPEDREYNLKHIQNGIKHGVPWNINHRLLLKDGSVKWMHAIGEPLFDKEGKIKSIVGIVQDITERKKAEQELKESYELTNAVVENVPLMIFLKEAKDLRFVIFNRAGEELLGYDRKELLGKNDLDLFPPEQAANFMAKDREVLDGDVEMLDIPEEPILTSKKGQRLLHTRKVCIKGSDGVTKYLLGISEDITDRKKAEEELMLSQERYSLARKAANMGSWDWDIINNVVTWLEDIDSMFGLKAGEFNRTYEAFLELVHEDDRRYVIDEVSAAVEKDKKYSIEYRVIWPDNSVHWHAAAATVFRDKDNKPLKMIGLVQDITEKKRMEEEMLKSEKMESIGVLAGGIAHDFNNILTGIIGNIGLAKFRSKNDKKLQDHLIAAEKSVMRATKLTQQLLTFAKGGKPLKEVVSIKEVITESSQFTVRGSNCRCKIDIGKNVYMVNADAGQIGQVINNLVINAKHAMPEGGTINVIAKNFKIEENSEIPLPKGDYVQIIVEDHGIGISSEHIARIFEPYFTTKQKGSGLGLAAVYSIIKNHNGHISVQSPPYGETGKKENGTAFYIYLPASNEQIVTEAGAEEVMTKKTGKILVMDDDKVIQSSLESILQHDGHDVSFVGDGLEAVSMYEKAMKSKKPFDVVILDLTVPAGMGGKDALKLIKDMDPEVNAIASSGYSDDDTIAENKRLGFNDFLGKPYTIDKLSNMIARALNFKLK